MANAITKTVKHPGLSSQAGTILVVEDEAMTRIKILRTLTGNKYQAVAAHSGEEALEQLQTRDFDLVVLDILLPGISGFEVCERIQQSPRKTPIIMLTALHALSDRLRGLSLGADDYMIKPFAPEELVARVQAVLRRSKKTAASVQTTQGLKIDFHAQKCFKNAQDLRLTPKEFQLLAGLCECPGTAVSRETLSRRLWGEKHFGSEKSLDVYIGRLRQKVEDDPEDPDLILTVRGFGYCCGQPAAAAATEFCLST